jgi:hypothetical protein
VRGWTHINLYATTDEEKPRTSYISMSRDYHNCDSP